jgi:Der1-like family
MADNVHRVGEGLSISDWFRSLPIVTQGWFGATVAMTLAVNLMNVDPGMFIWSWSKIYTKLELWRFVSCFCYAGPFKFSTVITVCKCCRFFAI